MTFELYLLRRKQKKNTDLDMSEEAIPTEMIKLCINTITLDEVTLEEEALGYFTQKKLQKMTTCDEWKNGEKQQIDQFMMKGMI